VAQEIFRVQFFMEKLPQDQASQYTFRRFVPAGAGWLILVTIMMTARAVLVREMSKKLGCNAHCPESEE
jgi:hypothetical protein